MRAAFLRYSKDVRFQQIDLQTPGLELLHERPYIFALPRLFSSDECARLRAKAEGSLAPQSFDDAVPRQRTSHGTTVRNEEVPTLRHRLARLVRVAVTQLQPLKVSRYRAGERFEIHTDNVRGELLGAAAPPGDWWADEARRERGVPGAPISGAARVATVFVYLNDVARGGRTRWRWTEYDAALGGAHGRSFYEAPSAGSGRTDIEGGSGVEVAVQPREGMGVIHFPAMLPEAGGYTDYNAYHEAEAAIDEKWVAQQFIWSHPRLDWRRVLEEENWEPLRRRSSDTI